MTTDPGAMSPWPFSIKRVFKDTFRVLRGNLRPAVGLVFWSVLQTVGYAALRLAKEAAGAQELARVFD